MQNELFRDDPQYRASLDIIKRLHAAGHEAYIAGGAVRDALLGRFPLKDVDIATSARPEESRLLFKHTVPVGESFGVLIVLSGGFTFEVATFREESDYQDGRHPQQLSFSSAEEDVKRRDFTINGMLYNPIKGEIMDLIGGRRDLEAGVIRTIGCASERFDEDHLRLLRAIRFAAQLSFTIEAQTFAAIREHATGIQTVSMERIEQELDRLFQAEEPHQSLQLLLDSGLLGPVQQKLLDERPPVARKNDATQGAGGNLTWSKSLAATQKAAEAENTLAAWLAFLLDALDTNPDEMHNYQPEALRSRVMAMARSLRVPRSRMKALATAARLCCELQTWPDARLAKRIRLIREAESRAAWQLADAAGLRGVPHHDELDKLVEDHAWHWWPKPLLDGRELQKLGARQGPHLGEIMQELENRQLEDSCFTKDQALELLREKGWITG